MEGGIVKQGSLYMQNHQRFGKKWRKVWGVLYGGAPSGVARLEMYDGSQPPDSGRRPECWRMIQLSDFITVSERSGENSPKDTRTFSIETTQRVYLLASEISEQPVWVKALCSLAFPQERLSLERRCSQPPISSGLHMQENALYSTSRESGFVVRVRQTEASIRCGLSGMYTLTAEGTCLSLRERQNGNLLYNWPYQYLRRFGRDKTMFSFEAGRRCTSGEGNFEFETPLGGQIFQAIEGAINSKCGDAPTPSGYGPYTEESSSGSRPPLPSPSLPKGTINPTPGQKGSGLMKSTIQESEYAMPFDKVAQNLLVTGFGGLLGPPPTSQRKGHTVHQAEHIYDEPEAHPNLVYDEPEGMRVEAWRSQGTDAHEAGYEFPYLPGWDDYAVPRAGGNTCDGRGLGGEEDEWGKEVKGEREYDNITLRGGHET
ncbi:docking protein 2 [Rhinophrynus dorsalis]